ncbi:MAG: hypothetical protein G01um101470_771 [Parcubacteria group bacterium Gr01-1014_70]|nr:MAG: hypothetical protein G01um101470_771 [Parcubacteria group bacterium Gr01-1014_70]
MNKNTLITILIVLLLGSIGGAVYFAQKGPVILGQQASVEVCGILPLFTGQLGSGSDGPGSFIAQDICYMVFAHEGNDAAICNKVKTPNLKGECYSTLAMKGEGADVCASAPADAGDRCYSQIAEKLGDPNACEKIKSINDRENCISNFASRTGDGSLCKKITNVNTRDYCYINASRNNPSLCNEISSPNVKQDCLRGPGR